MSYVLINLFNVDNYFAKMADMKLLVLSDSHGRTGKLKNIIDENSDADMIIYLGDGERDFEAAVSNTNTEHIQVCGNCDRMSMEQVTIIREFAGVKFYITHGFEQGVKYGLGKIETLCSYSGCSVALFGHTHRQHLSENCGVTLFNPGAVANGEYGVITLAAGKAVFEHRSE